MGLDFSLTREQEEIRDLAHEFAEKEMRPVAERYDENEETPWDVMRKAHDLGLDATASFPEQYGGGGLDLMTNLILEEELSWGDAGIAVAIGATGLAGAGDHRHGHRGAEGEVHRHVQRPQGAADRRHGPHRAQQRLGLAGARDHRDPGRRRLRPQRHQAVLHQRRASPTCRSRSPPPTSRLGPAGIAGFVIEKGTPGMRQGRKERKLGVRASHTAQVIFEDCFVPEDAAPRLRQERQRSTGPGAIGAMLMLEATRPMVAAGALGIARAAFEFARDYSLERVAFGKPIAKHEAIAFKLADMATEIDAARLLTWRAGWMAMNGIPFARGEGSMAKLFAGDMAMRVTIDAVQMLGGYGYIKDYPVERFMRDAKIYQIWEGTAEIQRLVISRYILGERTAAARPSLVAQTPNGVAAAS